MTGILVCRPGRVVIMAALLLGFLVQPLSAGMFAISQEAQPQGSTGADGSKGVSDQSGVRQLDQPPWPSRSGGPRLLSEPFENPRQLLRLFDIGDSQLESFADGQPLGDEDQEALIRILYRIPQIDLASIHRWQSEQVPWPALTERPGEMRTCYYLLRGRVGRVEKLVLSSRLSELFEFDHYYRVALESDETGHPIAVCVREIPAAWLDRSAAGERVRISAMFLKVGDRSVDAAELIFAANRVGWVPDRVNPQLGTRRAHALLGNLDMDVGQLEFPKRRNRLPIGGSERECFYELLSAAQQAAAAQMAEVVEPMDLASLLQDPGEWHGRVVDVRGSVRRITRVLVDEPDIRARFGIDHYYQLDVLVPLGDQRIEFQNKRGQTEGPVYQNSFPFTFCVAQLPESWREFVGRERMNERMATRGFFFKLWSYPSAYVTAYDVDQRQLSPMFVASQPAVSPGTSGGQAAGGWMLGLGFLVVLAFLWLAVWRMQRSDRKFLREKVRRRFADEDPVSLDNIEP